MKIVELAHLPAPADKLHEDGLPACGDDGDDARLARKIVAGEEDAGAVESVFEQAPQVAAEAEALPSGRRVGRVQRR